MTERTEMPTDEEPRAERSDVVAAVAKETAKWEPVVDAALHAVSCHLRDIANAVRLERDRCAEIAEQDALTVLQESAPNSYANGYRMAGENIAAAIRRQPATRFPTSR